MRMPEPWLKQAERKGQQKVAGDGVSHTCRDCDVHDIVAGGLFQGGQVGAYKFGHGQAP